MLKMFVAKSSRKLLRFCDCALIALKRMLLAGLDSYSALVLVQHMRDLAAQQRTIIASVHQPRVAIWDMFNKVEVLSEGCLLYFGPTSKVCLSAAQLQNGAI